MSKFRTLDPQMARSFEKEAIRFYREGSTSVVEKTGENGDKTFEHSKLLGQFRSVFPFEFFPDELIVSERRVIWIHRWGPGMSKAISIFPQDIADIEASHGPIFGHLHVRNFTGNEEILIEHLRKKDVIKARDLIEGLVSIRRGGSRLERTKPEERSKKVEKLMHVDF